MLYLIGGAPRCGKTTVARRVAASMCCSRLPADYLSTAFSNYIPAAELAARYPAWATATVDDRYARYTSAEVIGIYRTRAATTWPGLRDLLSYAAHDRHAMVVEGYHLEPGWLAEFGRTHAAFPIRTLVLVRADAAQLALDLRRSTDPTDWVLCSAREDVTFARVAQMVCDYSAWFAAEAMRHGLDVYAMDGDYNTAVAGAVRELTAS